MGLHYYRVTYEFGNKKGMGHGVIPMVISGVNTFNVEGAHKHLMEKFKFDTLKILTHVEITEEEYKKGYWNKTNSSLYGYLEHENV